jgi:hypothetical protein
MPAPDTIAGRDTDFLTHLFLKAPLPNLPHPCRLFQHTEDMKTSEFSHPQLVDWYHTVASAIEAGFRANAKLSPSAWVRTTSNLIAHILQGILTTRNFRPDRESLDIDEFKKLLNEDNWEAVQQNLTNLQHLSQIFPPPLPSGKPPLVCGHCCHQMSPEANNHLSMADYHNILLATDHSRASIMAHLKNHVIANIDRDIQV